jgi:hypothetical protein
MAPAHALGRLRLYSDRQFLLEGYRYLAEQDSQSLPIQASGPLLILSAPHDLKRRRELLEERIADLGSDHPQARRYQRLLEEMEEYVKDRQQRWRDTHFLPVPEPSNLLILVLGGP